MEMAATTYYYAYINAENIVEQIIDLPAPVTSPSYIAIDSHDETLIGKRYNPATGEFETVTWFYYVMLDGKDIVTEVIRRETALPVVPDNMVQIQSYDQTLVGKWYDRANGVFLDPPIHVLAELSTDQVNVGTQDKWLTDKLDEMDARDASMESQAGAVAGRVGGVESRVGNVESRASAAESRLDAVEPRTRHALKTTISEISENTVFTEQQATKHYSFPFAAKQKELPKYVLIQASWSAGRYFDAVNIYLVRNGDKTEMHAFAKDGTITKSGSSSVYDVSTEHRFCPDAGKEIKCFTMSMNGDKVSTSGAHHFVLNDFTSSSYDYANVGNFTYDETGVKFDIQFNYATPNKMPVTRFKLRGFAY